MQRRSLLRRAAVALAASALAGAAQAVFSAGRLARSREPDAAQALIRFLASPAAAGAIVDSGMEPMGAAGRN